MLLGEGPCVDAPRGGPVLVPELRGQLASSLWPAFTPSCLEAGAEAVFALPLQVGAIRVGAIEPNSGAGRGPGHGAAEHRHHLGLRGPASVRLPLRTHLGRCGKGRGCLSSPTGHYGGVTGGETTSTLERVDAAARERLLAETFVDLADTLVDDFDIIDFLHMLAERCVRLLDVTAAGLMLADHEGQLRITASSTERARLLELLEVQSDEGPCLDCFAEGAAVVEGALGEPGRHSRWPRFAAEARAAGFQSVVALPLRWRDETIGALNLFSMDPKPLRPAEHLLAQALADAATIGLLQERGVRQREVVAQQLQTALNSRVIIEQATGVLAERNNVDVESAFRLLRSAARARQERLSEFARRVVLGEAGAPLLAETSSHRS